MRRLQPLNKAADSIVVALFSSAAPVPALAAERLRRARVAEAVAAMLCAGATRHSRALRDRLVASSEAAWAAPAAAPQPQLWRAAAPELAAAESVEVLRLIASAGAGTPLLASPPAPAPFVFAPSSFRCATASTSVLAALLRRVAALHALHRGAAVAAAEAADEAEAAAAAAAAEDEDDAEDEEGAGCSAAAAAAAAKEEALWRRIIDDALLSAES